MLRRDACPPGYSSTSPRRWVRICNSRKAGSLVRIHGTDGRIRDADTVPPGNDPHPPKDTRH